jgi:anti-sigma factor (TIGR02949 family)
MAERSDPTLLDRLWRLRGGGNDEPARSEPSATLEAASSGCDEVDDIPCSEAIERVYESLDGELDEEREDEVRCHLEKCRRCYPMYDWERMFLDFVRESADRPEENPELRRKVESLLDREAEG